MEQKARIRPLIVVVLYWLLCFVVSIGEFVEAWMNDSFIGMKWITAFFLTCLYFVLVLLECYTQIWPYKRKLNRKYFTLPQRNSYTKLEEDSNSIKLDTMSSDESLPAENERPKDYFEEPEENIPVQESNDFLKEYVFQEYRANLWSRFVFQWFSGILKIGNKTPFQLEHLGKLPTVDSCQLNHDRMDLIWEVEKLKRKDSWSLWRTYFRTFARNLCYCGLFKFLYDVMTTIQPLLLSSIISYVNTVQSPNFDGFQSTDEITLTQFLR